MQQSLSSKRAQIAALQKDIDAQAKQSAPSPSHGSWWRDILSDENGLSFHRFQIVLWTIILGMIFIWTVANSFSMPEFEPTLLLLMGISSGTYLGFKFKEG